MESSTDLPQEELVILPGEQWRSSYNETALKTLEKFDRKMRVYPPDGKDVVEREREARRNKLSHYLDAVDGQIAGSFKVFESQEHPGVRFPYSSVDVNKVAGLVHSRPVNLEQEKSPSSKLTYVIFTGFSPTPGGDPNDEIHAVYDRVFTVLPEIKNHPNQDVAVHVLGLPTSRWGSVSAEWVEGLVKGAGETHADPEEYKKSEYGFSQHGKLYAEFLRTVLSQNTRVKFYGSSMGSIIASETAKQLPEIWNNLRILVDVPTGTHRPTGKTIELPFAGKVPFSMKGMQAVIGFGAEYELRKLFDPLVKQSFGSKDAARQALVDLLKKQGMISHDSDEQNRLKKDANRQEIKLLVRGTSLDTDDFRSYVVQGMLDPATVTPKRILSLISGKKFFQAGNRSLGMGINYTHWMDRGRWINRWIKKIEQYES